MSTMAGSKRGEGVTIGMVHIGYYDTAVEAAVAYAKHAAGEEVVRPVPAAAMEVEVKEVEVKEAEGYKLHLANQSNNGTGYMGVFELKGRFKAERMVLLARRFTSACMIQRWRRRWHTQSTQPLGEEVRKTRRR